MGKARARWTYPSLQVSDHDGQFGERVGETSRLSNIRPEVVETPAEVLDEVISESQPSVPESSASSSGYRARPGRWSGRRCARL